MCTHRTAIRNERIRAINTDEVAFTVRANDQGGKRLQRLPGEEFVRRFMLHVLPTGIKRIRYYGVLASSCKGGQLTAARKSLKMPQPNAQATECAHDFLARVARIDVRLCPCCKAGGLHEAWVCAKFGFAAQEAWGDAARCVGQARVGKRNTAAQRHDAWVLCPFATMLSG